MAHLDADENARPKVIGRPFEKGWKGGPGRPKRETERAYIKAIIGLCPLTTWGQIVERAVQDALDGDRYARDWLTNHLIPDPSAVLDDDELPSPVRAFTEALTDEQLDQYIAKLKAARSD